MKKFLLYLWQLPQNIAGFLLTRKANAIQYVECKDSEIVPIYYTSNVFGVGISLGNYIVLDFSEYFNSNDMLTINHEHGHQKQSRYLGWLYLLTVGLYSAIFVNLWNRLFHKKWSEEKRYRWYYTRCTEKWADELGEVERFEEC